MPRVEPTEEARAADRRDASAAMCVGRGKRMGMVKGFADYAKLQIELMHALRAEKSGKAVY